MRAIYYHKLDTLTPIASSEDNNFPAENILQVHLDTPWRSTGTTESVVFDSAGLIKIDCVAIAGHNLSDSAIIKFQMNASDSWGTPALDETLTWRDGIIIKYFISTELRFCRFYFEDPANADGYISIGRVSASEYLQFDPSSLSEFKIENVRNDLAQTSISNQIYAHVGVAYRTFSYQFPPSSVSMISSIRGMYNIIGKHTPFFFMNYDTRFSEIEPAYVRIVNNITEDWRAYDKIAYTLDLAETG